MFNKLLRPFSLLLIGSILFELNIPGSCWPARQITSASVGTGPVVNSQALAINLSASRHLVRIPYLGRLLIRYQSGNAKNVLGPLDQMPRWQLSHYLKVMEQLMIPFSTGRMLFTIYRPDLDQEIEVGLLEYTRGSQISYSLLVVSRENGQPLAGAEVMLIKGANAEVHLKDPRSETLVPDKSYLRRAITMAVLNDSIAQWSSMRVNDDPRSGHLTVSPSAQAMYAALARDPRLFVTYVNDRWHVRKGLQTNYKDDNKKPPHFGPLSATQGSGWLRFDPLRRRIIKRLTEFLKNFFAFQFMRSRFRRISTASLSAA